MSKYDEIVEVEKTDQYDHIEEVEKFNPFHDSQGKFSSSNGFKSYSANPNTKAGAMAIARSAAAGHMNTVNVHRAAQSTGTTIRQNANWLGQGKQQTRSQTGSATLNRRVEPASGLRGASATGAKWQAQNQLQGNHTQVSQKPAKKPAKQQAQQQNQQQTQQTQQKPAQQQQPTGKYSLDSATQSVQLHTGDKLALQPRNKSGHNTNTQKAANAHDQEHVVGKDISKTADISTVKGHKDAIDAMAELQGWNKAPTVTDNLETFQKAAKQSGTMMYRTVHGNYNTGQTSMDICKETMADGNAPLGGTGGKIYGAGLYMVGAQTNNKTGRNLAHQQWNSQKESFCYGDTQMMATIHPSAKIASPTKANQLVREYRNLSYSDQQRFGNYSSYIASKGYDGARWHTSADPYITMYNKSAMIFYSGVST